MFLGYEGYIGTFKVQNGIWVHLGYHDYLSMFMVHVVSWYV